MAINPNEVVWDAEVINPDEIKWDKPIFIQPHSSLLSRVVRTVMGASPIESAKTIQEAGRNIPSPLPNENLLFYLNRIKQKPELKAREEEITSRGTLPQFGNLMQAGLLVGGAKNPIQTAKLLGKFATLEGLSNVTGINKRIQNIQNPNVRDVADIAKFGIEGGLATQKWTPTLKRIPGIKQGIQGIGKGVEYLKKSTADYVTTKVAPRAYEIYQQAVSKFTPEIQKFAEEKLKIPSQAIASVKKFGIDAISKVRLAYNDTVDPIVQKVEQGFSNKRQLANEAYGEAIDNFKDNSINSQSFYQTIQKGLRKKGWIDLQGNPTTRYKGGLNPITDKLTDLYMDMRSGVTTKGKKIAGQIISKEDFSTYREALSDMLRDKPSDILIMQAKNALYDSAENSGMKGIKVARNLESQAFKAEETLFKKGLINQKKLDNFQKLTEAEKRHLRLVEQYTGKKFVDDLDAITADRALDKLREYNPDRFANDLNKAIDPKWTEYIRKEYKGLLGDKADVIFDEIVAHRRGVKIRKGTLIGAGLGATGLPIISTIRRKMMRE